MEERETKAEEGIDVTPVILGYFVSPSLAGRNGCHAKKKKS